ncbi:MAG: hypothetical protein WCA55_00350, partial [Xanthobacteraceae bacterium]
KAPLGRAGLIKGLRVEGGGHGAKGNGTISLDALAANYTLVSAAAPQFRHQSTNREILPAELRKTRCGVTIL